MNILTESFAIPAAIGGTCMFVGSAGNVILDVINLREEVTREHLLHGASALLLAAASGWMAFAAWMVITG
ncbi:hypothetical protein C5D04_10110 [Rathayibacter sp. AY1D2]|uniref:hypothetical protein n=1 Tax=unclassified Rathayibacter TaxID=2609250 RepID=UPI000CE7B70C|nr:MULTISPECIES: hypothetical protein [unclassified Rathayibacter]PPG79283.1 hypothetical protein C5C52_12655 [Rathayibacter sp. AY1E5]PPH18447.1 hypothetical protein C5C99_13650 [Rathayibacter sp. AY1C4]PPH27142.1 hypothetical protein C5C37_14445 [Rathayibacter sp. AY1F9]PPH43728.1 hypothetical protein C5D09_14540 [Rathayibacter sp. AY1C9]PPH65124.1 hypothetical protein C5D25_04710 [Rathayibacter sp. AY1D7]